MREDPGFGWGLLDSRPNRKASLLCNEVPHTRGRLRETAQRLGFGRGVVFEGLLEASFLSLLFLKFALGQPVSNFHLKKFESKVERDPEK